MTSEAIFQQLQLTARGRRRARLGPWLAISIAGFVFAFTTEVDGLPAGAVAGFSALLFGIGCVLLDSEPVPVARHKPVLHNETAAALLRRFDFELSSQGLTKLPWVNSGTVVPSEPHEDRAAEISVRSRPRRRAEIGLSYFPVLKRRI
jgi:hypothetical protein